MGSSEWGGLGQGGGCGVTLAGSNKCDTSTPYLMDFPRAWPEGHLLSLKYLCLPHWHSGQARGKSSGWGRGGEDVKLSPDFTTSFSQRWNLASEELDSRFRGNDAEDLGWNE
ncbi:hypothetical protein ASG47_04665 [Devosia sp. Leaf420]|nr:hypothetical protein ASG47_04665 [Devosia sp. Leaf420]